MGRPERKSRVSSMKDRSEAWESALGGLKRQWMGLPSWDSIEWYDLVGERRIGVCRDFFCEVG